MTTPKREAPSDELEAPQTASATAREYTDPCPHTVFTWIEWRDEAIKVCDDCTLVLETASADDWADDLSEADYRRAEASAREAAAESFGGGVA